MKLTKTTEAAHWLARFPLCPYIRRADYGIRSRTTLPLERRLLDYQLIYVQEGQCVIRTPHAEFVMEPGSFCCLQPNVLHSHHIAKPGIIMPFIHLDLFYNPLRGDGFPVPPGIADISAHQHLIQPNLNLIFPSKSGTGRARTGVTELDHPLFEPASQRTDHG